jgi:uncharacterized membrane protein
MRDYGNALTNKAVQHSWLGITSLLVFGFLALWRVKRKNEFPPVEQKLYWLGMLIGVAVIGATGYLGAHVMD